MIKSIAAGALYFVFVFAIAFALGAVRVSFVAPVTGAVWATALELPFTLAASWVVTTGVMRRAGITTLRPAVAMSATAFVLLMGAEAAGAMLIFGRTFGEHLQSFATPAGALGLAGQIVFGLFPVVQVQRAARGA